MSVKFFLAFPLFFSTFPIPDTRMPQFLLPWLRVRVNQNIIIRHSRFSFVCHTRTKELWKATVFNQRDQLSSYFCWGYDLQIWLAFFQDDEKRKDPHLFHDPHPQRKVGMLNDLFSANYHLICCHSWRKWVTMFHDPVWSGKSGQLAIWKRIAVRQIEKLAPLSTDCVRPPLTFQMIKLKCFDRWNFQE